MTTPKDERPAPGLEGKASQTPSSTPSRPPAPTNLVPLTPERPDKK